ncbi:MAG: hypothetical protein H0W08_09945 [Acidobacteria bacterium]|nr:hypothetical protein [Acidobacteriota bacterium]
MNPREPLHLLLYLYPAVFRERFGLEIQEYLTMRRAEVAQEGCIAVVWLTAGLAAELTGSGLKERIRAFAAADAVVACVALTLGFGFSTILLAGAVLTFEELVRQPLYQIAKSGAHGVAGLGRVGTMVVAVVALAAGYSRARRPHASPRHEATSHPLFRFDSAPLRS